MTRQMFARVHVPMDHVLAGAVLYGFVEMEPREGGYAPARTYCASSQPSAFVHAVGWLNVPEESAGAEEGDSGYFNWYQSKAWVTEEPWEAEDEDAAREECQGNW